jgi:hypothetical protein
MEGYLNKNVDSFYSRQLLTQYNINVKDPLTIDLSEDLNKKSFSLDIDNSLFIPTISGDDSSDEEIITILSNLIVKSTNSEAKESITLFSTEKEKEITYDPSKDCLLHKMKLSDIMTDILDIENTQMYSDDES